MKVPSIQKDILDTYFARLRETGYINDKEVAQTVFAILLLDSVLSFGEYATESFKLDVDRIMHNIYMCNCNITWGSGSFFKPFFVMGEATSPCCLDIDALKEQVKTLTAELARVDQKASAGL